MSLSKNAAVAAAACAAVAAIAAMTARNAGAAERKIAPAPAFTAKQLAELPTGNWVTNGGNVLNQRYSPLTFLNRDNVKDLKALWRSFYTVPGPGEFGPDTWPSGSNAWQFGGAPVWQTPAVDPDLGLTSSKCITISGTTTRPIPWCCSTRR